MSADDDTTRTAAADPAETVAVPDTPAGASSFPVVPGYEVLGGIGQGGMGVVYKATQTAVNRTVALKLMHGGSDASPTAEARFQIEAEAVASIQHPGVVQLFEFGHVGVARYIALEYVSGGTLAHRIEAKPYSPREAAALVATLADAVHAAHAKGVLHRDLKPANVLVTETGEPKVTDFGLARIGQSELTVAGAIMGTPSYMSPEQAAGDGKKVGTPADVWALGAILYELLVGRPPFRRDTVAATLHAVVHDTPESPRKLNRKVARDLETICLKCLQRDPADRYRTADALAADLRAYLGGFPVAARPVGFLRRTWKLVRRNPVRSAILTAVLSVGVWVGACIPRYAPTTADSPPPGVRVSRDGAAEEMFYTAGQRATVYRYTGAPMDFWVEVTRPGLPPEVLRVEPWELDPVDAAREVQGPGTAGRWVWTRGERDKKGDEVWRVGQTQTTPDPDSPFASTAATLRNAFGGGEGSVTATKGRTYSGERRIAFGKPTGSSWENGAGGFTNPLPEDRPVCLHDSDGGFGDDRNNPQYTVRVMCQILTPEIAERLKADRESAKKAKE